MMGKSILWAIRSMRASSAGRAGTRASRWSETSCEMSALVIWKNYATRTNAGTAQTNADKATTILCCICVRLRLCLRWSALRRFCGLRCVVSESRSELCLDVQINAHPFSRVESSRDIESDEAVQDGCSDA